MVRILTYNILMGGVNRVDPLARLIASAQPDVVGLVEASNAQVVEEIAQRLEMQCTLTGRGAYRADWQIGVLSCLPILSTQVHTNPAIFARKHFMEVRVQEPDGQELTIFAIHQRSDFHRGPQSNHERRREVEEMLRIMAPHQGTPHLVMGDFNSLAPGESFQISELFRYFIDQRAQFRRQHTKQRAISPKRRLRIAARHFIVRMINIAVHNPLLSPLVDQMGRLFAQGGIDLFLQAGYIDCFRQLHPDEPGYTIHSGAPVVRIDFIFASPELAQRLQSCTVISEGDGVKAEQASDHLPLCAEFAESTQT